MGKKKIKTFTVDVETYDSLVAMFKEHEAEVSVSYYVDRCLKDLLKYLSTLDALRRKEPQKYSLPMSFVIDTIAREPKMSMLEWDEQPGETYVTGTDEMDELQVRYEAERKKIPLRFWRYLRSGYYRWSADRKHIINSKTGYAYSVDEHGELVDAPLHDVPIPT